MLLFDYIFFELKNACIIDIWVVSHYKNYVSEAHSFFIHVLMFYMKVKEEDC